MEQIYSAVAAGNSWLNDIVWGIPALFLLMGAGIILTVGLKGFQFRKFGYAMKNTVGKMFKKQEAKAGEVTPLQAQNLVRPQSRLTAPVRFTPSVGGRFLFQGPPLSCGHLPICS